MQTLDTYNKGKGFYCCSHKWQHSNRNSYSRLIQQRLLTLGVWQCYLLCHIAHRVSSAVKVSYSVCSYQLHFQLQWHLDGIFHLQCWGESRKKNKKTLQKSSEHSSLEIYILQPAKCGSHFGSCNCHFCLTLGCVRCSNLATEIFPITRLWLLLWHVLSVTVWFLTPLHFLINLWVIYLQIPLWSAS